MRRGRGFRHSAASPSFFKLGEPAAARVRRDTSDTERFPKMRAALASALLACLMSTQTAAPPVARKFEADLVIVNASVRTLDPKTPDAEAVAVYGNRVAATGTSAEVRALAGPRTRVVDAGGALCCRALTTRTYTFCRAASSFRASTCATRPRPRSSPSASAASRKNFRGGVGSRAATGITSAGRRRRASPLPTKELIDSFTPTARSSSIGSTATWRSPTVTRSNSRASRATRPTRPAGQIVRDAKTGEPTGVLKDAAMSYVWKVVPESSFEEKLEAARAATAHAAAHGVTSVQDMSAGNDVGVLPDSARTRRVEDARLRRLAAAGLGAARARRRPPRLRE